LVPTLLSGGGAAALAQQVEAHFSCSQAREEDGERVTYADSGKIRIQGNRIDVFRWESALFRSTHGFDCSIDESDGLQTEVGDAPGTAIWRVALSDACGVASILSAA
jgi:hypothetical protein